MILDSTHIEYWGIGADEQPVRSSRLALGFSADARISLVARLCGKQLVAWTCSSCGNFVSSMDMPIMATLVQSHAARLCRAPHVTSWAACLMLNLVTLSHHKSPHMLNPFGNRRRHY